MEFVYEYQEVEPMQIKQYFHLLDLPRGFTTSVKFGGQILCNHQPVSVRAMLHKGDRLTLVTSPEIGHDSVVPSFLPIDIVYEDRDILVVNKPSDVVSIPSIKDPDSAMANRVKGYYVQQGYEDQVIHIVTRLDRDTSGLMLIAKHRLAHAFLDRQIQAKQIQKYYHAISSKNNWPDHGLIDAPIMRCETSIIRRKVGEKGKAAQTEYWVEERYQEGSLLILQLHTGRTHQIRVHLSHEGGPLIGDDLYGGPLVSLLKRQALHCGRLCFEHPFTKKRLDIKQPVPQDMQEWIDQQKR